MTLRLIDKELHAKLDALTTNNGFSEKLNEFTVYQLIDGNYRLFKVHFGDRFAVAVSINELEVVDRYSPEMWNAFPEVQPEEGLWMKVEVAGSDCGYKAKFEDGRWIDGRGGEIFGGPDDIEAGGPAGRIVRFRPWDELTWRTR